MNEDEKQMTVRVKRATYDALAAMADKGSRTVSKQVRMCLERITKTRDK